MIRFCLAQIRETAKHRPPGYLEAVLTAGRFDGDHVELTRAAYDRLRKEYSPRAYELPGAGEVARHFAASMLRWTRAGFATVPRAVYARRMDTCRGCPMWEPAKNAGLGGCERCGCTQIKHWLATEKCPAGLWPV